MLHLPFEIKPCPQKCGKVCGNALEKCPVFPQLSPEFQEVCENNLHLLQYLLMLPLDDMEIPNYYEKITRKLMGTKDPNIIYSVGRGVFVHVLANPEDIRDYYISIEPSIIDSQNLLPFLFTHLLIPLLKLGYRLKRQLSVRHHPIWSCLIWQCSRQQK